MMNDKKMRTFEIYDADGRLITTLTAFSLVYVENKFVLLQYEDNLSSVIVLSNISVIKELINSQ